METIIVDIKRTVSPKQQMNTNIVPINNNNNIIKYPSPHLVRNLYEFHCLRHGSDLRALFAHLTGCHII